MKHVKLFLISIIIFNCAAGSSQGLLNQYDKAAIEFKSQVKNISKNLEDSKVTEDMLNQIMTDIQNAERLKNDAKYSTRISIKKSLFIHEDNKTKFSSLLNSYYEPHINKLRINLLNVIDSDIKKAEIIFNQIKSSYEKINWDKSKSSLSQLDKLNSLYQKSTDIFNTITLINQNQSIFESRELIIQLDKKITEIENLLSRECISFRTQSKELKCRHNLKIIEILDSGNLPVIKDELKKQSDPIEQIKQSYKNKFPPIRDFDSEINSIYELRFKGSLCNDSLTFTKALNNCKSANILQSNINYKTLPKDKFTNEKLKKSLISSFANENYDEDEWEKFLVIDIYLTEKSKWEEYPPSPGTNVNLRYLYADVYVRSKNSNDCYLLKDVNFNQKINHYTGSYSYISCGIPDSYEKYPCKISGTTITQSKNKIIECQAVEYFILCLDDISLFISKIEHPLKYDYYKTATNSFHYIKSYIANHSSEISIDILDTINSSLDQIEELLPNLSVKTTTNDEYVMRTTLWITLTKNKINRMAENCEK